MPTNIYEEPHQEFAQRLASRLRPASGLYSLCNKIKGGIHDIETKKANEPKASCKHTAAGCLNYDKGDKMIGDDTKSRKSWYIIRS